MSKKARREAENLAAPGGMRSPHRYVQANKAATETGLVVTAAITQFIVKHPLVVTWLIDEMETGRRKLSSSMELELVEAIGGALGTTDVRKGPRSRWRAGLVEAFITKSGDPETCLPTWLREGVPTGVVHEIKPSGIFPRVESQQEATTELWRHYAQSAAKSNYKSAEENREAFAKEVDRLINAKYVTKYASYDELKNHFAGVIISKVAALIKQREDGSQKVRIIIDMLRSRVNEFVKLSERIVLPRLMDVVSDILALLEAAARTGTTDGEEISIMVADFQDAFHTLGVLKSERPFQVFKLPCGGYGVYETAVFGGGGSPLTWGRAAAFLGRSSQSLFCPSRARIQLYVDDPLTVWRGTPGQIRTMKTVCLLWWIALGLEVAWAKVQHGTSVKWIGAQVTVAEDKVALSLPAEFAQGLAKDAESYLAQTVVPAQKLRRLAGKAAWAGGFIPAVGAMIAPLWAAAGATQGQENRDTSPRSEVGTLVPVTRARHALTWILAWTRGVSGTLRREFTHSVHYARPKVRMDFDASPWGYGAVLFWMERPVEYFGVPISDEDISKFDIIIGDHRYQTLCENLAILIGARHWLPWWKTQRAQVRVRTDSAAAVGAWTKERSPSPAINTIVREAALDMAEGLYKIDVTEHIPGWTNELPDALSRMYQPGKPKIPPQELLVCKRVWPSKRVESWWRARDGIWEEGS